MRAAKLASELLDVLESLESVSYGALLEPAVSEACLAVAKEREWEGKVLTLPLECPVGEDPALAAISRMVNHRAHLVALHDRLYITATRFKVKGKPGRTTGDALEFLSRASVLVKTHLGKPLNKGKRESHFARTLCRLAGINSGVASALENL